MRQIQVDSSEKLKESKLCSWTKSSVKVNFNNIGLTSLYFITIMICSKYLTHAVEWPTPLSILHLAPVLKFCLKTFENQSACHLEVTTLQIEHHNVYLKRGYNISKVSIMQGGHKSKYTCTPPLFSITYPPILALLLLVDVEHKQRMTDAFHPRPPAYATD